MPPLLVKRTGFVPRMSVSRYCLDTILECGSLFTLSVAEGLRFSYIYKTGEIPSRFRETLANQRPLVSILSTDHEEP